MSYSPQMSICYSQLHLLRNHCHCNTILLLTQSRRGEDGLALRRLLLTYGFSGSFLLKCLSSLSIASRSSSSLLIPWDLPNLELLERTHSENTQGSYKSNWTDIRLKHNTDNSR